MVDWEDVWEDFDLKRGAVIMVVGILLIAAGVFLIRDYFLAQRLDNQLAQGLDKLNSFYDTFKPSANDTSKMKKEIEDLRAEIQSQSKVLLNSQSGNENDKDVLDLSVVESELRRVAQREGVRIKDVSFGLEGVDGYLLVHPLEVEFEGTRATIPNFLYGIREMPYLNELKADRISSRGTTTITIRFFSFDVQGWREGNPCQTVMSVPSIDLPEVDGLYVFKGNLASRRMQIMDKKSKLTKELKQVDEICQVERELKMLKDKLSLIQEKT